jgi:type II restriction/modification system DNA methylase subunit YeeA
MHRYKKDTIARIRTDYVHERQGVYNSRLEELDRKINESSGAEKIKYTKLLQDTKTKADELHKYEEKIHHLADQMIEINLDDGVKHNYEIFKDVLAKIK